MLPFDFVDEFIIHVIIFGFTNTSNFPFSLIFLFFFLILNFPIPFAIFYFSRLIQSLAGFDFMICGLIFRVLFSCILLQHILSFTIQFSSAMNKRHSFYLRKNLVQFFTIKRRLDLVCLLYFFFLKFSFFILENKLKFVLILFLRQCVDCYVCCRPKNINKIYLTNNLKSI